MCCRRVQIIALVAVGAMLGYLAAHMEGGGNLASGATLTSLLRGGKSTADEKICCTKGLSRQSLVVNSDADQTTLVALQQASASGTKPNILMIMGDDIGWFNPSCYNHGLMGYQTPNIDRIAKEGALFTDWYGQQSCTAGRAAFITGQSPTRTGLTKVGLPGADVGLQKEDPSAAEILKNLGYAT